MEELSNTVGIFGEDGGSNGEEKLKGGSGDWEDVENQPKKEPGRDQSSSSVVNQSMFKMEVKVDIKPYHDDIDALKLKQWLLQMEFYFSAIRSRKEERYHSCC